MSETNNSIHQKPKTNNNREFAYACFNLLHSLDSLIGGIDDGVTDPFHGEPVKEDFKEGL